MTNAMRLPLAIAVLACMLAGCTPDPASEPAFESAAETQGAITLGGVEVRVFVADDPSEWQQGLQGYEALKDGQGMLFVFDDVAARTFAMKDVSFPIDVVFFDENLTVDAIYPLDPSDTQIVGSPGPSSYVLELPQGWAEANGITLGSELEVPE